MFQGVARKEKNSIPAALPPCRSPPFSVLWSQRSSSLGGVQQVERKVEFSHFCHKHFWVKGRTALKVEHNWIFWGVQPRMDLCFSSSYIDMHLPRHGGDFPTWPPVILASWSHAFVLFPPKLSRGAVLEIMGCCRRDRVWLEAKS